VIPLRALLVRERPRWRRIIANSTHAEFVEVSACHGYRSRTSGARFEAAESRLLSLGRRTILFVDEIHRFNRSQQDALLHAVEDRTVVLVGATTENPYFEVNSCTAIALSRGGT
jgi:putative ATPase